MLKRLRERIKRWWAGEIIPAEYGHGVDIGFGLKRHWAARAARAFLGWLPANWYKLAIILLTIIGFVFFGVRK